MGDDERQLYRHSTREDTLSTLGYEDLVQAIEDEAQEAAYRIRLEPYDRSRVKTASLDLHIGASYARFSHGGNYAQTMAPKALAQISDQDFQVTRGLAYGDSFAVRPGEMVLVAVDQWIGLGAGLVGEVQGKSSVGRAGQIPHLAGLVEPGFLGVLTLECANLAPFAVVYEVGQPIAQLVVRRMLRPTARPYGHPEMQSRYQGQHEVTPPRRYPGLPTYGTVTMPGGVS